MQRSAVKIVQALQAAGHTAYYAGGAVRDMLLGRRVSDIDIATSATPEEVEQLFPRTRPIGREFGVMLVLLGGQAYEVATFRGESDYDGRRPGKVYFTTAEADALRRDFTINGLFYDPITKKIWDFVRGQHDLRAKRLRFIGVPSERIAEDHLRLLRGVRLASTLALEYEPATHAAICQHAALIARISPERVNAEMTKILVSPRRAYGMRELIATGLAQEILPELMALTALPQPTEYHREGDTLTHSLATLAALPARASLPVAWAALLHDIGKAQTIVRTKRITYPGHAGVGAKLVQQIGKRLRWDRATLARVAWLTEQHMTLGDIPHMRPAHRHRLFTHPYFPDLLAVCRADARGTVPADQSLVRRVGRLYRETTGALALPAPRALLTGREIMSELHLPAGPEVGRLVRVLHDAQVESLVHDRASALAFLKKCVTR